MDLYTERELYDLGKKSGALEEIKLLEELIEEKKVDRISNNEYNITIEVVALGNLKNHIENRISKLKEERDDLNSNKTQ